MRLVKAVKSCQCSNPVNVSIISKALSNMFWPRIMGHSKSKNPKGKGAIQRTYKPKGGGGPFKERTNPKGEGAIQRTYEPKGGGGHSKNVRTQRGRGPFKERTNPKGEGAIQRTYKPKGGGGPFKERTNPKGKRAIQRTYENSLKFQKLSTCDASVIAKWDHLQRCTIYTMNFCKIIWYF